MSFKKNLYLFVVEALKFFTPKIILNPNATILPSGLKGTNFFGYYNLSPFSKNNNKLLNLTTASNIKLPTGKESVNINITDFNTKNTIKITTGTAWNWQQGNMLQWLGHEKQKIIFNIYDDILKKYCAEITDENGNFEKKIDSAIYTVAKNGTFALTLNFERLALMRKDYGYFCNKEITLPDLDNDGVFFVDLIENHTRLILSLNEIISFKFEESMTGAQHKVNHLDLNPSGSRFMFLHRWNKGAKRYMRLLTADIDGKNLFCVSGINMVSHNCWLGDNRIISFCNHKNLGNNYILFNDKTEEYKILSENLPKTDGHPAISPSGKWLMVDTYPNKFRYSKLFLYNFIENRIVLVGKFYQPVYFTGENRIDLHPKWSDNDNLIAFESGHLGKRNLMIIDITKITQ